MKAMRSNLNWNINMTEQNPINNPLGLTPAEKPYYDLFVKDSGRSPDSFAELMGYSIQMQESNKQMGKFWKSVFGL